MVGVIWYRFVRCGGTDWSDTLVPIHPLQWYRFADIINPFGVKKKTWYRHMGEIGLRSKQVSAQQTWRKECVRVYLSFSKEMGGKIWRSREKDVTMQH